MAKRTTVDLSHHKGPASSGEILMLKDAFARFEQSVQRLEKSTLVRLGAILFGKSQTRMSGQTPDIRP